MVLQLEVVVEGVGGIGHLVGDGQLLPEQRALVSSATAALLRLGVQAHVVRRQGRVGVQRAEQAHGVEARPGQDAVRVEGARTQ